jgi:DNA-binding response OmpR family regulator
VRFGDVEVRLGSRTVLRRGAPVSLRPKEFELLRALVLRPGVVLSRRDLLGEVWGYDPAVRTRTVDTHVLTLRRKLEDDPTAPRHLVTARKAGYMLRLHAEP